MAKIVLDPEAFKVLASDTRIQILKNLDERPKTVSELSRQLELNKATVFEHLQQLVHGELVKKKDKDGRKWVYYTLTYKGTSLLHPERATFMVLFSMAALGGVGAIWQLGQWLAWWALPGLGGTGEPGPEGDREGTSGDGADQDDAGAPESSQEAPAADRGAGPQGDDSGFFEFLGDPAFWIFIGLIAATLALVVAAVLVRRSGRRQSRLVEHLATHEDPT